MTDLELLDTYCERCFDIIDPFLLREVERRGLYSIINHLPMDKSQAKGVVRARLGKWGRYTGDPEIEKFADKVPRLESLRSQLQQLNMADAHRVTPLLNEMTALSQWVANYYQ